MTKLAVQQIEVAFTRDGGDAYSAAMFEAQLPKARTIRDQQTAPRAQPSALYYRLCKSSA